MSVEQTRETLVKRLTIDGTNYRMAAGTTDTLVSDAVDTLGYESIRALLLVGTLTATAVTDLRAKQCDTTGGTYADLLATKVSLTAATHDNKVASLEIIQPRERFLKFETNRATANAVIDGLIVILSNPRKGPVTADGTIIGSEGHVSPIDGTA